MKSIKKKTYKHLLFQGGTYTVTVPIVRGNTIGLDNTCKAHKELAAFFEGEESVYQSLKSLYNDVFREHLWSCKNSDQAEELLSILCRGDKYWRSVNYLRNRWVSGKIPAEFMSTLIADPFIDAIGLDPMCRDNILGYREMSTCSFGIRKSEGIETQILTKVLRNFFKENKQSIIDNCKTTSIELENTIWKRSVLEELSQKEVFQEKNVDADALKMILDFLNTKFEEKKSVHHPERLFRFSLPTHNYKGDIKNNEMICKYFEDLVGNLTYEEIIGYIKNFIQWDDLEVFPEIKVKGVFNRIHESGRDFIYASDNYEERMNIAIQFFIGTANSVLKKNGKTISNFGMAIEGVYLSDSGKKKFNANEAMIGSLMTKLRELISNKQVSFIDQLPNEILKWMNESRVQLGIKEDISDGDIEEIKSLFSSNFSKIMGSPHFDEFLIRHEGGSIWKNIQGVMATDLRNIYKYGFERYEHIIVPELVGSKYISSDSKFFENFSLKFLISALKREISINYKKKWIKYIEEFGFFKHDCKRFKTWLLMQAAKNGDIDNVRSLINKGADKHAKDERGRTWLMHLMYQIIKDLNQVDFDLDAIRDEERGTALFWAVGRGDLGVVKQLIERGAPLDQRYGSLTALMFAAIFGHVEVVKALINNDASLDLQGGSLDLQGGSIDLQGGARVTALMIAANYGDVEVVKALINKGASLDQVSAEGLTALMIAARQGHVEVVKALINKDASLDQRRSRDPLDQRIRVLPHRRDTALMIAVREGHVEVVKALINKGASLDLLSGCGDTVLLMAVHFGHAEVVKALINKGASPDQRSDSGQTVLTVAAEFGHVEVVKVLINKGASLDLRDGCGDTALMRAAEVGHEEVVKALINEGASLDQKNAQGMTALMMAAEKGHEEVVKAWINKDASLDQRNGSFWGWSALMFAAELGHVEVVKALINKGASLDQESAEDLTALMMAAERGHVEVVKAWINKDASLDQKNAKGLTALMIAANCGDVEVVKALINKGASLDQKNAEGLTALMMAAKRGHVEVVKALIHSGADVNAKDINGISILVRAAKKCDSGAHDGTVANYKKIIDVLVNAGIRLYEKENRNNISYLVSPSGRHLCDIHKELKTHIIAHVLKPKFAIKIQTLFRDYRMRKQQKTADNQVSNNDNAGEKELGGHKKHKLEAASSLPATKKMRLQ